MIPHSVSGSGRCEVDYDPPTVAGLQSVERVEACQLVPSKGRGLCELKTIAFDVLQETVDVLARLKELGYRPATYEELVGYTKVCAPLPLHDRVVALGTIMHIDGGRSCAYFDWSPDELKLEIGHHESLWRYTHFLAVPL